MAAGLPPIETRSAIIEPENTTHYSVVDEAGNAVAVTTTLNETFGSAVTADRTCTRGSATSTCARAASNSSTAEAIIGE